MSCEAGRLGIRVQLYPRVGPPSGPAGLFTYFLRFYNGQYTAKPEGCA